MSKRLKKGDKVVVIAGRDKGTQGEILRVLPDNRVIVEGVQKVKRHQRPTPRMQQGGIIEKEAPVAASNVMLLDPKSETPTRVRRELDKDGRKVRVAVNSGTVLDS